jgi:peptidoglycan-N-acetylglucosamine deacetylase
MRIASLSCDLDDKWSYMKTHGDGGWETFPSYLDLVVPRIMSCFKQQDLLATFFIVGQDAVPEKNHGLFRAIVEAGHEVGNHSFRHEPWLHLYSEEEIKKEMAMAEDHIERATGQRPVGFRGPGYSLSRPTVMELIQRGYLYDATTFPTFLMPLARLYYFTTANFSSQEKSQRKSLGGRLRDGLRPNKPYCWRLDGRTLLEIPVTTLPGFKLPLHMSYLLALKLFSPKLALGYLDLGLRLCRVAGVEPSIVLHPTDFLGSEDEQGLLFIPGMGLPLEKKLEFVNEVLNRLKGAYSVVTLREHAAMVAQRTTLAVMSPSF